MRRRPRRSIPARRVLDARAPERFARRDRADRRGRRATCPAPATIRPARVVGADGRLLPPARTARAFAAALGPAPPPDTRHDVRLGRHRLPPAARAGARRTAGRPALSRAAGASGRAIPRVRSPAARPERPRPRSRFTRGPASDYRARLFFRQPRRPRAERPRQWTTPNARPATRAPGSVEDSLDLYDVNAWGNGYFGINAAGHVVVRPDWTRGPRDRPARGRHRAWPRATSRRRSSCASRTSCATA